MELDKNSLSKLLKIKDSLEEQPLSVKYKGDTSTGISPINLTENKLFLFKFTKEDVHKFITIFNDINRKKIDSIKTQLIISCEEMMQFNISPIECMLYASKTINNQMGMNYQFMQMVSDVIYLSSQKKKLCIDSLEHIIKNWTWDNQLKISIWSCGKIGDEKLLDYIYKRFSTDDSFKYFCFAALIDSAKQIFIHEILEMVSKLDDINQIDRQMANYFNKKFRLNFHSQGLDQIENLLIRSIGSFPSRLLTKITGRNERDVISEAIEAQESKEVSKIEKIFNKCIQLIESKSGMRTKAIIALGFLKYPKAGPYLLDCLDSRNNLNFTTPELQRIVLVFGYLKYENAKDILYKLESNDLLKCHVWYSLYMIGENSYLNILIKSFFNENKETLLKNYTKVFQQFQSSIHLLKSEFIDTFYSIIEQKNEEKITIAISNLKYLVNGMKAFYFFEMNDIIFYLFGYNEGNNNIQINVQTQLNVLSILNNVITASNSQRFQNFLFYIYSGNVKISESVKIQAMQLLRDRNKFDWKPPTN